MMRTPFLSMPVKHFTEYFHHVQNRGLNLELQLSWRAFEEDNEHIWDAILAEKSSRGMELTLHAPFIDMGPGADDPLIREATWTRFAQTAKLAERLRPVAIVVHPGYDERRYWMDENGFVNRSVTTWKRLLEITESTGCVIALENIYEKLPDMLVAVIKKVDSKRFGACFDSGHFNVFSATSMETWLGEIGGYVKELHLHNNHGGWDEHHGLKNGTFNFRKMFDILGDMGVKPIITLEPHEESGVEESLDVLREIGAITGT